MNRAMKFELMRNMKKLDKLADLDDLELKESELEEFPREPHCAEIQDSNREVDSDQQPKQLVKESADRNSLDDYPMYQVWPSRQEQRDHSDKLKKLCKNIRSLDFRKPVTGNIVHAVICSIAVTEYRGACRRKTPLGEFKQKFLSGQHSGIVKRYIFSDWLENRLEFVA